jgi:hypothetical protein
MAFERGSMGAGSTTRGTRFTSENAWGINGRARAGQHKTPVLDAAAFGTRACMARASLHIEHLNRSQVKQWLTDAMLGATATARADTRERGEREGSSNDHQSLFVLDDGERSCSMPRARGYLHVHARPISRERRCRRGAKSGLKELRERGMRRCGRVRRRPPRRSDSSATPSWSPSTDALSSELGNMGRAMAQELGLADAAAQQFVALHRLPSVWNDRSPGRSGELPPGACRSGTARPPSPVPGRTPECSTATLNAGSLPLPRCGPLGRLSTYLRRSLLRSAVVHRPAAAFRRRSRARRRAAYQASHKPKTGTTFR